MIHHACHPAFPRARLLPRLLAVFLTMVLALSPAGPAMGAEPEPEPADAAETADAETADADAPDDPDAAQPAEAAGNAGADAEADAEGADSPEVFIPSEEISEDFAVSFPVDI